MSRITKCKHVLKEMSEDDLDLPKKCQQIVRILRSRGNNLHEVETSESEEIFLVSMPTKFRKNLWIKRGDYVLIEPIEEGDKVRGEICRILTPEHIKEYTKHNVWPKKFTKNRESIQEADNGNGSDDKILVRNVNRLPLYGMQHVDENNSSNEDGDDGD